MFWQKHPVAALTFATFFLTSCGDDSKSSSNSVNGSDEGIVAITDKTISGVTQKGPFVNGSSVTVQELDGETLAQTGGSFEGKIKNDMGEFSVKVKKLESQYALLKATGFYRNEVTGEKSKSQLTLYALTNLSNRDEVNVNLLTHLAYERALYLATEEELSVTEAKKQAEAEVLKSFGIEGDFAAAEDLNIFGESDQNAALLAISILMQGDLSEADFSERLANYAADIETDGIWNDSKTATKIADWASMLGLGNGLKKIRENITNWNLSTSLPNFEKYVNRFWWKKYGLEICDKKHEGKVQSVTSEKSNNKGVYFICKEDSWHKATDIEKDTATWGKGEFDGEVRSGQVTKNIYYIYESSKKAWREASAIEIDTYDYENNKDWAQGKDSDCKYGSVVTEKCYVFENNTWRIGNKSDCSLGLRGCTKTRQDSIGKGYDEVWYICEEQKWRAATDIEKDTATWGKGKFDGEVRSGQVTKKIYYIYESSKNAWRNATTLEKDTYDYENNKPWIAGEDGETKKGFLTDTVYIFESSKWRSPNEIEIEYGYCTDEKQDMIVNGREATQLTVYVCYNKQWRYVEKGQSCTEFNGGYAFYYDCHADNSIYGCNTWENRGIKYFGVIFICVKNLWDTVQDDVYLQKTCDIQHENEFISITNTKGLWQEDYYVCHDEKWNTVSRVEYLNGFCTEKKNNTFAIDSLNQRYHVCRNNSWNEITKGMYLMESSIPKEKVFNDKIPYGKLLDERDGKTYRTVIIGTREWMAENLDYPGCDDYFGCSYSWSEAMNVDRGCDRNRCVINEPHQGICPDGWHIPSGDEWEQLFIDVGENNYAMMSSAAWSSETTDDYGFSIIPVPLFWDDGRYPSQSFHWSSTQYSNSSQDYSYAMQWYVSDGVNEGENKADLGHNPKEYEFYVRCVKDEE